MARKRGSLKVMRSILEGSTSCFHSTATRRIHRQIARFASNIQTRLPRSYAPVAEMKALNIDVVVGLARR